jgi:hypothetical protein
MRYDREVCQRQSLQRVYLRLSLELLQVLKALGLVASPVQQKTLQLFQLPKKPHLKIKLQKMKVRRKILGAFSMTLLGWLPFIRIEMNSISGEGLFLPK